MQSKSCKPTSMVFVDFQTISSMRAPLFSLDHVCWMQVMKKCSAVRVDQADIGWVDTSLRSAIAIAIVASESTEETSGGKKREREKRKKEKEKAKYSIISWCSSTPASCFPGWLPAYSQCNHQRNALNPINPVWPHDQFQSRGYAGDVSVPVLSALSFGFLPTPVTRRSFAERMCLRAWCFPA